MATKGRDSPLGLLGTGTAPGASTPKAFLRRMLGGGAARGGPRHPGVTVPAAGSAAVTMPRGSIKGAASRAPLPEMARGPTEDMREDVLEEPVELLGGG